MAADTRATGGPSDASPEPREDAIAVAFAHAYQYAAYRHATIGAFEGRLRELGFAVTPLDAERTAHPVAASAAADVEAVRRNFIERVRLSKGDAQAEDYGQLLRWAIDEVADDIRRAALAAAPPRAIEPAEAAIVTLAAEWEARVNRRVGRSLVAIEDDLAEAVQRASR